MSRTSTRSAYEVFARHAERITQNVAQVIQGKDEVIQLATVALLAEGHLLIDDVPGVGKTMLGKALAKSVDCSFRRIQFTPDLLPTDVTGVKILTPDGREAEFRPGPVFSNILLGDEINRASPKTQAALLECMEERQVTVDGDTYLMERPFMVVATQNPVEHEGTYPLPEAEVDRFSMRIRIGYPEASEESRMLDVHGDSDPLATLGAVLKASDVVKLIDLASRVYAADELKAYMVQLLIATREHRDTTLGASPRAGLMLLRTSRVRAATQGRDFVSPDDVQALAEPVLAHRLALTPEAQLSGTVTEDIVADALKSVPVPGRKRR